MRENAKPRNDRLISAYRQNFYAMWRAFQGGANSFRVWLQEPLDVESLMSQSPVPVDANLDIVTFTYRKVPGRRCVEILADGIRVDVRPGGDI